MNTKVEAAANLTIVDELRRLAGRLQPGARLPTVRDLVVRYSVTQHAIQSALAALSAEGVVTTHVGRGTFVTAADRKDGARTARSILTLLNQTEYERGDVVGQLLHQKLLRAGHRSLILTYQDPGDAIRILREAPRYDASILQPRTSVLPVDLLAVLKDRSDFVVVESRALDGLDVDAISNDPAVATHLILEHLRSLGHKRIAWVIEEHDDYFYERTVPIFESYRVWTNLTDAEAPLLRLPKRPTHFGFADLAEGLQKLFSSGKSKAPTALVLLTFDSAERILAAFDKIGIRVPEDVSLVRIGSPDLESDHAGVITTLGRPSEQAADAVLQRMEWRWANPKEPFQTVFDRPQLFQFKSTCQLKG